MVDPSANAEKAQHGGGRLGDQMREAAHSLLHEKKERVAMVVDGFADAFRHAAGALDRNRQRAAARYAKQAAGRIERVSAGVRTRDFSDLVASAEGFASRRPELFVAAAIAAGFVLGRLLIRSARGDLPLELGAAQERL
jgi:ElaB/YqjD/DUF883 family membrane-anchored ribosome-binding protein